MVGVVLFNSGLAAFLFALLLPLPFLLSPDKRVRYLSLWLHLLASILFLCLSLLVLTTNQPLKISAWQIIPQAGFSFVFDRLAAFFVFIISTVSLCAGIYSLRYEHGDICAPAAVKDDYALSLVEAARGQTVQWVRVKGGLVDRWKVRTASSCNWRAIEHAVLGNIVPDFPLINKSLNLSYAGTDL